MFLTCLHPTFYADWSSCSLVISRVWQIAQIYFTTLAKRVLRIVKHLPAPCTHVYCHFTFGCHIGLAARGRCSTYRDALTSSKLRPLISIIIKSFMLLALNSNPALFFVIFITIIYLRMTLLMVGSQKYWEACLIEKMHHSWRQFCPADPEEITSALLL